MADRSAILEQYTISNVDETGEFADVYIKWHWADEPLITQQAVMPAQDLSTTLADVPSPTADTIDWV